jgi:hypothetical protein
LPLYGTWAENYPQTDGLSDYFDVPFFESCDFGQWYNCPAKNSYGFYAVREIEVKQIKFI